MPLTAMLFQGQQYIQQRVGRNNSPTPCPGQDHVIWFWPPSLLTDSPPGCAPAPLGKHGCSTSVSQSRGDLNWPCPVATEAGAGAQGRGVSTSPLGRSSGGREGYTVATILKAGISDLASGPDGDVEQERKATATEP